MQYYGLDESFLTSLAKAAQDIYLQNFPEEAPEQADRRPSIYIAGPMRGRKHFNFDAFLSAEADLEEIGWKVLSPASHDLDSGFDPISSGLTGHESPADLGFDLIAALKWDMNAVLDADAIYMLEDWELSNGATAEHYLAVASGKTIYYAVEECVDCPACSMESDYLSGGKGDLATHLLAQDEEEPARGYGDPSRFSFSISEETELKVGDEVAPVNAKTGEVRTTSSTGGDKGVKPQRFDLIPIGALTRLAEHYGVGALKYDDNQWRKGYEWSKSYAALMRHLTAWWNGEDIDEETGSNHMAAVAWHAFTILTFIEEHPGHDDRFRRPE